MILRAGNDTEMRNSLSMQSSEVGVIMGQDRATVCDCVRQHIRIVKLLVCSAGLLSSSNVVAKAAQFFNNRHWEIFICV